MAEGKDYINDGYAYHVRKRDNRISLICKEKKHKLCPGRGKLIDGVLHLTKKTHTHPRDENLLAIAQFKDALREAVITQNRSLKEIFDEIKIFHDIGRTEEYSYKKMYITMHRWRSTHKPPSPTSFEECIQIINGRRYSNLFRYDFGTVDVAHIDDTIVLMDRVLSASMAIKHVYINSDTITPISLREIGSKYLTQISGDYKGYVFPLAYMISKDRNIRRSLRYCISSLLPPNETPDTFICDFESQMILILRQEYPDVTIVTSFDNYCQILLQRAMTMGIDIANLEIRNVLKKLAAVILLPPWHVEIGFDQIRLEDVHEGGLTNILFEYLKEFRDTWIEKIDPTDFSLFQQYDGLTDVPMQQRRTMITRFKSEMSIWKCFETIIMFINNAALAKKKLDNDKSIYIATIFKKKTCLECKLIMKLWDEYEEGNMMKSAFLETASKIMENYLNDIVFLERYIPEELAIVINYSDIEPEENDEMIDEVENANINENGIGVHNNNNEDDDAHDEVNVLFCIICHQNVIDTVWVPCNHVLTCLTCAIQTERHKNTEFLKCPFCNEPANYERAFLPY